MLEQVLHVAEPWLEQYGYAALLGAMFLEGVGIPAPGLTFLIAAVLLASRGEMRLVPAVLLALTGFLSGCQLGFLIGRTGGRRLLLRIGLLNRTRLRGLQRLLAHWGGWLLVAAPFLDGTRQYGAVVAGAAHMDWRRFTLYNLSGAVLWIGLWSIAMELFGHHLEPALALVHRSAPWLLGGVAVALMALLIHRWVPPRRP